MHIRTVLGATALLLANIALAAAVLLPPLDMEPIEERSLPPRLRQGLAFSRQGFGAHEKRDTAWRMQNDGRAGWVLAEGEEGEGEGSARKEEVKLVPVALGVMSRCPDAIICEGTFDKVLSQVGNKVDLDLVYIGTLNSSATYGVDCKHGDIECKGNIQQLCYKKTYPQQRDWWSFLQCQNYAGLSKVGEDALAESCARVGGKNWADAQKCVDDRGAQLLQASVRTANHMGVTTSCSVFINNRLVCIHDGVWRNCDAGHEVKDFVKQIEDEFEQINK